MNELLSMYMLLLKYKGEIQRVEHYDCEGNGPNFYLVTIKMPHSVSNDPLQISGPFSTYRTLYEV